MDGAEVLGKAGCTSHGDELLWREAHAGQINLAHEDVASQEGTKHIDEDCRTLVVIRSLVLRERVITQIQTS